MSVVRRTQATRIYPLRPGPTRMGQQPITWWWRSLAELLGGVLVVLGAMYLLWGVVPW
jgi:hypothetical protein